MTDPVAVVNEVVAGMRLEVELVDGTVHTVPVNLDFTSLSAADSEKAFALGDKKAGRISAAFVALKANQTLSLSDDALLEVVDVLEGLMDGDETHFEVLNDPPDAVPATAATAPRTPSPAALEVLSG